MTFFSLKRFAICIFILGCGISSASSYHNPNWTIPFEPFKIVGNVYYVGTKDLASYLITSPQGHILVNSTLVENVPRIKTSVEKLGFKFTDVKILLINHAHWDHCAGSAEILRLTRAKYVVMDGDAAVVESGGRTDFEYGKDTSTYYTPAKVDRILHDNDAVTIGNTKLIACKTPGHTKGCTTWTLNVKEGKNTYNVMILGGLFVNPGYDLLDCAEYPTMSSDYAASIKRLKNMKCDIVLGAHASYFNMEERYALIGKSNVNPFVGKNEHLEYVNNMENFYKAELKKQRKKAR